jgi:glyoxylase-like metal-dependent hydrolase (beta-lactamase superfamily II)
MRLILLIAVTVAGIAVIIVSALVWKIYNKIIKIKVIQFDSNLKIYIGGGGNSIVLTSRDGLNAVIVDTKFLTGPGRLKKDVKAKNVTIINTHYHPDHTNGNRLFPGATIIAGEYSQEQWKNGLLMNSRYPDITIKPGKDHVILIDDEIVHVTNMGQAHTRNDLIVYFEKRKILATGDITFNRMHAVMFKDECSVSSWIGTLEKLESRYKEVEVVPGHGDMTDARIFSEVRGYFIDAGSAVGNQSKQKESKEKYNSYFSIPGIISFCKTMEFIKKEKAYKV